MMNIRTAYEFLPSTADEVELSILVSLTTEIRPTRFSHRNSENVMNVFGA